MNVFFSQDCGSNPADIHFLIDSSGSVQSSNFQKQLDFVKAFANSFNISSSAVRIGVTTFSSVQHQQFWMNDHMTKPDLVSAITAIPYQSGWDSILFLHYLFDNNGIMLNSFDRSNKLSAINNTNEWYNIYSFGSKSSIKKFYLILKRTRCTSK